MDELEDRFKGAILGLAIGDALGFPVEFQSRRQILDTFGHRGVTDFVRHRGHPPGTYSDDTQMSIAVAEGLLDAGREASEDELMSAVARRFVAWSRSPENNRAPGNTCMTACARLAAGTHWRSAAVTSSKGCGSAMRVTALGLLFADDLERMADLSRVSSLVTHGHPAALEGAVAAALCVALGLRDSTPDEMIADVNEACRGRDADFDAAMDRLVRLREAPPEVALSRAGIGEAWVAEEAIASALYCVARTPGDFVATVLCGANTDGDSDSIAAIAGSISGALNGLSSIPPAWVSGVENSKELLDLADRLLDAYNAPIIAG